MSKLVSSFKSFSGASKLEPVPLSFPDGWGIGPIFDWYESLIDPQAKVVEALEVRKDIGGAVPHRFVVLRMCNGQVHRFDRRPNRSPDAKVHTVDLLFNQAVSCQDSYVLDVLPGSDQDVMIHNSVREIGLALNGRVDFIRVISACYAISSGTSTRDYSFLRYNCFFFSWTILMVASRHYMPHTVPSPDVVHKKLISNLDSVVGPLVDQVVALLRDFVVTILEAFRNRASDGWQGDLRVFTRFLWVLPTDVFRFVWQQAVTARLHFGLRKELTKRIQNVLVAMVAPAQGRVLSKDSTLERLKDHLWVEDTSSLIKGELETEIREILWTYVLDGLSAGFGDLDLDKFTAELHDGHLKLSRLLPKTAQLSMVWNAAIHCGLKAVKDITPSLSGLCDECAFDKAWDIAQGAALEAAQRVVRSTSEALNSPRRDELWEMVWSIWPECWDDARQKVRRRALEFLRNHLEDLLTWGVGTILQEMRRSTVNMIEVQIPNGPIKSHAESRKMTGSQLQQHMLKIIREGTVSKGALDAVTESMGHIWKDSSKVLVEPSGTTASLCDFYSK